MVYFEFSEIDGKVVLLYLQIMSHNSKDTGKFYR